MYIESAIEKFNKLKDNYNNQDIYVLGVETSCDETAIAIVKNGRQVVSNVISSQIEIHNRFGGVVPEVASRNHLLAIDNVLQEVLNKAEMKLQDINAIAVTYGAGLMGALMVGVTYAKSLAFALNLPLIKVNHIKGHISANYIAHQNLKPPYISLIVSGGHTALIKVEDYNKSTLIGSTTDDAVGEAYDKVAKVLGLDYPGGPVIDRLAKQGEGKIDFIKYHNQKNNFNFSYSGLKTAVINYLHKLKQQKIEPNVQDICTSFQIQAITPLIDKSINACKKYKVNSLVVAGGVAANSYLREHLKFEANAQNINAFFPPLHFCTDNAAMVAAEGYFNIINGVGLADIDLTAQPGLHLKNALKNI